MVGDAARISGRTGCRLAGEDSEGGARAAVVLLGRAAIVLPAFRLAAAHHPFAPRSGPQVSVTTVYCPS